VAKTGVNLITSKGALDVLFGWYLKPILAVFQLYRGVSVVEQNIITKICQKQNICICMKN
jgi:hypothetical protein